MSHVSYDINFYNNLFSPAFNFLIVFCIIFIRIIFFFLLTDCRILKVFPKKERFKDTKKSWSIILSLHREVSLLQESKLSITQNCRCKF